MQTTGKSTQRMQTMIKRYRPTTMLLPVPIVRQLTNTYSRSNCTDSRIKEEDLPAPKLSRMEYQIMEALWEKSERSLREIQESFPAKERPAYTTIQTMVYRMEAKGIVRRLRKVGNFHLFAASITRDAAQRRLVDDLVTLFGGRSQLLMAHLIKGGKLSLTDVTEAEKMLRQLSSKEKQP
jgi:BlaI family transcriptional regulator, penicillinase repressor